MYRSDASVNATVTITIGEDLIHSYQLALEPEAETPSSERSSTSIEAIEGKLVITTSASDVSALRASLNSYLRWVDGIQGVLRDTG